MERISEFPNLVVIRTVSKLGLAGIRLGYLIGRPEWVEQLDKVRPPYNVSVLTQAAALFMLDQLDVLEEQAARILAERKNLGEALKALKGVTVYPSEANFFLVRVPDAARAYEASSSRTSWCATCIRGSATACASPSARRTKTVYFLLHCAKRCHENR